MPTNVTRLTADRSIEESYADLAGAICAEAVREYRFAWKMLQSGADSWGGEVATLEAFFRGDWFFFLTQGKIDGEYIIEEVRRQCKTSKTISDLISRL